MSCSDNSLDLMKSEQTSLCLASPTRMQTLLTSLEIHNWVAHVNIQRHRTCGNASQTRQVCERWEKIDDLNESICGVSCTFLQLFLGRHVPQRWQDISNLMELLGCFKSYIWKHLKVLTMVECYARNGDYQGYVGGHLKVTVPGPLLVLTKRPT